MGYYVSGLGTGRTPVDRDSLNSLTSSERRSHDPNTPMSRGRLVDMEGQGADRAPTLHLAQGPTLSAVSVPTLTVPRTVGD